MLMARGTARDEAQKLHRKWLKHRAFMVELACNKEWLAKIELEGQELIQEQPELRPVVQQKLEEMRECWSELESTTKAKARQLFEHRPQVEVKSLEQLDHQLSHLEQQPPQLEQTHYLPTASQQLHKTKVDSQMGDLYQDVGQLGSFQGISLAEPRVAAAEAEGEELEARAETRIVRLIEPLKERRRILLASKEMHQVAQDLEDEMLWIQERLPSATSKDYGSSFHSAQQQAKANQKLQRELASRRARVAEVLDRAGMIASLRTPEVDFVREGAEHVHQLWDVLQTETERRSAMLNAALQAQQYYGEAAKVESWLADQKLQLASQEKGLDEVSTLQLLKGHQSVEQTVEAYAESVGLLSQQCQHLLEIAHPESEQIMKQQSHIDRLYLSVKDMVEHRKTKLEQQYWLYQLNKDVEELEKWITEREVVASSTELGQDLEDVTVLQETFRQFVSETNSLGQQRLEQVNTLVNQMIKCGHADAATIAEWKDGLNESWADLLELMETRTQMLAASQQLHRFFTDCKEVQAQIARKAQQLPELRCCQASSSSSSSSSSAAALQRLRLSFEHGLQLLVAQVRQLQENASQLRTIYAGEKAEAILAQEQEVLEAWKQLLSCCEASHVQVTSVTDKVQFFSVVRENLMWMEGIMGQIRWDEPRDLTALEMMIKQHQELKGKIDGRSKTIQQCADLGKVLMAAGDSASDEIKEKLDSLLVKQRDLVEKWGKHEEKLQKKQERLHFVQETVKAEVWLKAKEPLITSNEPERGEAQTQKDEVEQLILRHQAFRKAAVTWKERFSSLRQLSATEKKQEELSTKSFSSQRMLPLSCLSASVPSTSSSSLFLRHVAQAHIEGKTNLDLSAPSATQRLCSSPASYNTVINNSGYSGLEQHCSGMVVSSKYVGKNHEVAGGGGDAAFSVVTSHRDGVDTSSYLTINLPRAGSAESSRDFGLTLGSVGRMQNHLGDGRLESSDTLLQQSSSTGGIPSYLHQQNMGSSAYLVQPQSLRCSGYVEQQSNLGDTVSFTQHHNVMDSGYLGQTYPSGGAIGSTDYLPQSQCSSGLASSAYLAKSGGMLEPRIAYTWQNLNSDFTQPRINNMHKAVHPLLEGRTMQGEHCGEIPPANTRGPETGLELLHSRLQRDPRGSRSDPQMDHLRQEREYKLGRQTSSEQEIQARLNELPMIVRQERYRRHLERQSSSEKEGSSKQRLQRQDSSDLEASIQTGSDRHTGEKRSTMAEIVEQVQEREAAHMRGETYRPPSSLSAPVTRFDGRPRARDRPKPRRRPRPKEPEESRRSRSAPATGAPTTPQPPSHTAQNEGFLYRKKVTTSDLEGQQRSPNSKSWVNIYCVLKEGKLTFYKDARNHNTTYNEEPLVDLSTCSFDPSMGYKKKKNVFILQTDDGNFFAFHAKDEEDLKAWTSNLTICIAEYKAMKKWDKPDVSSLDPDHSERKEKSEGDADARSERSEQALGDERSDKGDRSEKLDTSEIADRVEGGAGESSASLKSK